MFLGQAWAEGEGELQWTTHRLIRTEDCDPLLQRKGRAPSTPLIVTKEEERRLPRCQGSSPPDEEGVRIDLSSAVRAINAPRRVAPGQGPCEKKGQTASDPSAASG